MRGRFSVSPRRRPRAFQRRPLSDPNTEMSNLWELAREVNEDGWVEYWQRQLGDPREERASDQREPIRIASWPEQREIDALKDASRLLARALSVLYGKLRP